MQNRPVAAAVCGLVCVLGAAVNVIRRRHRDAPRMQPPDRSPAI
jgi:hypothetical protein